LGRGTLRAGPGKLRPPYTLTFAQLDPVLLSFDETLHPAGLPPRSLEEIHAMGGEAVMKLLMRW